MKTKLFILLTFIGLSLTSYSQNETVTINKSDLTPEQVQKLDKEKQLEQTKQTVENYSKMAGFGKEIGVAIRDGLNAVVDVSDKFSKTDVGQFTMTIIAWKLLYKDIVQIILGLLTIAVINYFIFIYYRSLSTHSVRKKGAWYQFWVTKEYEIIEESEFEGRQFIRFFLMVAIGCSFGIGYMIMF